MDISFLHGMMFHSSGGGGGGGTVALDDADKNPDLSNALNTTQDASVTIGSGTDRKVIGLVSIDDVDNGFVSHSVTFDPGGSDEVTGTAITGAAVSDQATDLYVDGFYMDIPDAVSSGTYTVRVTTGTNIRNLAIGAFALSDAESGQPEVVETAFENDFVTTFDNTITTLTNGAMVCEHVVIAREETLSPDDGQTEQYNSAGDTSSVTAIAGATSSVATAGSVDIGWSWTDVARWTQVAVSVAPA